MACSRWPAYRTGTMLTRSLKHHKAVGLDSCSLAEIFHELMTLFSKYWDFRQISDVWGRPYSSLIYEGSPDRVETAHFRHASQTFCDHWNITLSGTTWFSSQSQLLGSYFRQKIGTFAKDLRLGIQIIFDSVERSALQNCLLRSKMSESMLSFN